MTDGRMSISELADRSGLTIPTIKFYIRQGLLAPGTKMNRTRSWYGLDHRVRPRPHAGRTPFDGTEVIDIDLVLGLCQRVDVLDVGRIIASGSPEQIRADPAASRRISGTCRWTSDRTGDRARRSHGRLRRHGRGARSGRASWAPRGDRSAGPERGGQDDDAASDCRAAGAASGGRPGSAWWRCSRRWRPCCSAGPGRCREGSSRCLPSPGHWRPGRGACWWTR